MCAIPHFPVRKKSGRAFSPPCPLEFLRIARKHFPKVTFIELKQKLKIESESTGLRKFYFHMWNFIFTPSKQHLSGISNTCVAHIYQQQLPLGTKMAIGLKLHPWHRSPDWIICHLGDSAVNVLQDIYFLSGDIVCKF